MVQETAQVWKCSAPGASRASRKGVHTWTRQHLLQCPGICCTAGISRLMKQEKIGFIFDKTQLQKDYLKSSVPLIITLLFLLLLFPWSGLVCCRLWWTNVCLGHPVSLKSSIALGHTFLPPIHVSWWNWWNLLIISLQGLSGLFTRVFFYTNHYNGCCTCRNEIYQYYLPMIKSLLYEQMLCTRQLCHRVR